MRVSGDVQMLGGGGGLDEQSGSMVGDVQAWMHLMGSEPPPEPYRSNGDTRPGQNRGQHGTSTQTVEVPQQLEGRVRRGASRTGFEKDL